MNKLAVIKTGGKQYLVKEGDRIKAEKLNLKKGGVVNFDDVLLTEQEGDVRIGTPKLSGAKVEGKILKQERGKKVDVIKYKPKVRYRRKYGHRQAYSLIEIEKIIV